MSVTFSRPEADIFIPDGAEASAAFSRVTRVGIGAHQDDVEIMALDGILRCFGRTDAWFMGVVVTNGAGAPRGNLYAGYDDNDMLEIRRVEQRKAAYLGEYAVCAQLMHTSADIKDRNAEGPVQDLTKILALARPKAVYTHNLADKHDTHAAVALRVIEAIRRLPVADRPERLYGCEVWRGLDWLPDDAKTVFDVSSHPNIGAALVEVYDSQIAGGKRYDAAAFGRRRANATYLASHSVDKADEAIYGIDMSAFITDGSLDPAEFIGGYLDMFRKDVIDRITKFK